RPVNPDLDKDGACSASHMQDRHRDSHPPPQFDGAVYDVCKTTSDITGTSLNSDKRLHLQFPAILGPSFGPKDREQSVNNKCESRFYCNKGNSQAG
ncbi:hypothetical protein XPA_005504, partial [Xanthoria parietina]